MQVKYCRLETKGEVFALYFNTLITTSATSSHRKVLFSDVKPFRLYNNALPPQTTTTVALCSKKHFLKTSHKRKETWLKCNAQKKERKKPSSVRKLQKKQTTHIEANTPLCDFLMPSEVYVWDFLFLTLCLGASLWLSCKYNCTVHLLSLRNHCVFSKIWVHGRFSSYIEETGRMRRSEAALVGRHAERQIFDLCRILREHTRNKTTEATKTFSDMIWWHGNGS